jgi:allantoin racemase
VKRIAVTYPVPEGIVSPGFEIEVVYPIHHGSYAAPYSAVDYKLLELSNLEAGLRAEASGADAFFMNSGGDYGMADLRDNLHIPVVGGMQAAMLLAANFGARFSIVTIWPEEINHIHHRQLSLYGVESRCASIRNTVRFSEVATDDRHRSVVDGMHGAGADIIDRILAEIDLAATKDGADVVVLGCTCMHPIAELLATRSCLPVVDGTTAGYGMTELVVSSNQKPAQPRGGSKLIERGLLAETLASACSLSSSDVVSCGDMCDVSAMTDPSLAVKA